MVDKDDDDENVEKKKRFQIRETHSHKLNNGADDARTMRSFQ